MIPADVRDDFMRTCVFDLTLKIPGTKPPEGLPLTARAIRRASILTSGIVKGNHRRATL